MRAAIRKSEAFEPGIAGRRGSRRFHHGVFLTGYSQTKS